MVWTRGHGSDWDHFAAVSGDPGWGYEPVLDIYRRIENWQGTPDPQYSGTSARCGSSLPANLARLRALCSTPPRNSASRVSIALTAG